MSKYSFQLSLLYLLELEVFVFLFYGIMMVIIDCECVRGMCVADFNGGTTGCSFCE